MGVVSLKRAFHSVKGSTEYLIGADPDPSQFGIRWNSCRRWNIIHIQCTDINQWLCFIFAQGIILHVY